jgi:hypothetical protein
MGFQHLKFKLKFEYQQAKTMHRYEGNTHRIILFILEKHSKTFSYAIFPVKKNNVGKILKL